MTDEQIRLAEAYTRETQARQQVVRQYSWYGDPRWRCSLCKQHPNVCSCGTTPARDVVVEEPSPPPLVVRYGVPWCTVCDLAVAYCRGH